MGGATGLRCPRAVVACAAVLVVLAAAVILAATPEIRPDGPASGTLPSGAPEVAPEALPAPPLAEPAPRPQPRSWFILPATYWLPESKLGFAVATGRDFVVEGSRRPSDAFLVGAYSVVGQGSIDGATDVYLRDGSLLSARARAVNYPDAFYGIGPASRTSDREGFTRRFIDVSTSAELATLDGRLRAGPRLTFRAEELRDVVPGGFLETSGLDRIHGFNGVGAGGSITWDTRDHPLWPQHGSFAQAYYVRYPAALGRNDGFGKGAVDLRTFQPLGGGRVLGVSGVIESADGEVPFTLLSKLGNARFLRGYREGRYRDHVAWATQAELRAPIAGPLAGTVFFAVGDVAPALDALRADRLKPAGGVGARWRLTPAGANLRLDVAVGDLGPEVYVLLLEAF